MQIFASSNESITILFSMTHWLCLVPRSTDKLNRATGRVITAKIAAS